VIETLNWIILGLIVVLTAFYPLYLFFSKKKGQITADPAHPLREGVSVIIPCYNEENHIERKINELLALCKAYPPFEIIVLSDGSTDHTNDILGQFDGHEAVRVIFSHERHGKPYQLNIGVKAARYDLLVFSDARQRIDTNALSALLHHMDDPEVGAVSARLLNGVDDSFVRHLVNYFKMMESRTGSTVGAYGAFYALRRQYFRPIPEDTILDDLYLPTAVLAQGKRVLFEPKALVYDVDINRFYVDLRIARMIKGLLQFVDVHSGLIAQLPIRFKIYLFFQKYLKLVLPLLFIAHYLLNIALLDHPVFYACFLLETIAITGSLLLLFSNWSAEVRSVYLLFFRYLLFFGNMRENITVIWKKGIK
jgi:poly-beta-1,6-N-acetyl-D-glucosamine synthase